MDDLIFSYIALSMSFTALFYNIFCILNKKKRKKKSLCETCVYCMQKIDCGNYTKYFVSSECTYLGNIELCNAYKRRTDNA